MDGNYISSNLSHDLSYSNYTNWGPSPEQEQGNVISSNLLQDDFYSNYTNWTASSENEDPRVVATSYMIYKIGQFISQLFF